MTLNKGMFTSIDQNWKTPKEFYDNLNKEFNFNLDPCPSENIIDNALFMDWNGSVYVNPPYNNIENFISKGLIELKKGNCNNIVYLLPSRTGTKWFHNYVLKFASEIRFIRGRLKFSGSEWNAPFDSMVVIFKGQEQGKNEFDGSN